MVRQIVERIRKKDQRAMGQLYQTYVEELSSVCYRYVSDKNDAKDVLQNSFMKIFTSISTFEYRNEDSFRAWLKRIVVNEALLFLRSKKKLLFVEHNLSEDLQIAEEEPKVEQVSPNDIHRLISELPDGYRTVLNLYVFEGFSHRQIAEMLGIKEGTSASQLYYAKQLLAKKIRELTKDK